MSGGNPRRDSDILILETYGRAVVVLIAEVVIGDCDKLGYIIIRNGIGGVFFPIEGIMFEYLFRGVRFEDYFIERGAVLMRQCAFDVLN